VTSAVWLAFGAMLMLGLVDLVYKRGVAEQPADDRPAQVAGQGCPRSGGAGVAAVVRAARLDERHQLAPLASASGRNRSVCMVAMMPCSYHAVRPSFVNFSEMRRDPLASFKAARVDK
jgi:hypothetical protein